MAKTIGLLVKGKVKQTKTAPKEPDAKTAEAPKTEEKPAVKKKGAKPAETDPAADEGPATKTAPKEPDAKTAEA